MAPSLNTAIRSESASASSWSWVTKTNVLPDLLVQPLDLQLQGLAQLLVQRAQRFVHQQYARLVDDGPRERDPLLLAAGQLARLAAP